MLHHVPSRRALAVLEDDIAAIDERLMKCGSDVAAAVEIQKEKDVKVEKQGLYYAEWQRLEEVMAEAEATLAGDRYLRAEAGALARASALAFEIGRAHV